MKFETTSRIDIYQK